MLERSSKVCYRERSYEIDSLKGEYDELKRDHLKLIDTNDDLNHDIDACTRHLDTLTLQNNEVGLDKLVICVLIPCVVAPRT